MTKYILHGGYTSEKNELNEGYFTEMVDDVPEGGSILLVYFASNEDGIEEKYERDCARMKFFAGKNKISIIKATERDFHKQLKETDVVYIRGGDTQKLKAILDKYPDFVSLIKGKTVSGSSAGAYVLSKYYFTNSQNKVLEGYGCVPIRVICHYESEIHPAPDGVDPVTEMEKYDNNLELVLLRDYEWRVFNI